MSLIESVKIPEGSLGPWTVKKVHVSKSDSEITSLRAIMKGRGYVPPGTYTQLLCSGRGIVMSDTPDERRDHFYAVRMATGHVLINGLGIGMVLGAVLKKRVVTKVTIIEISPEVVALVGPHYSDRRLSIVTESAFNYQPPKGERYSMVWHDIWDNICADNLAEMTKLKRKYSRRTDWQGCWAEWECRRAAQADRSWR